MSNEKTQEIPVKIQGLNDLVAGVFKPTGQKQEITRRDLFKAAIPRHIFPTRGSLVVDKTKCTVCTLCAQECVSGALVVEGEGALNLVFREEKCDSCGQCVKICPENCLKLDKGTGNDEPLVLLDDEFARCTRCGKIIGPKVMINKIGQKLGKTDQTTLWLCPECKVTKR